MREETNVDPADPRRRRLLYGAVAAGAAAAGAGFAWWRLRPEQGDPGAAQRLWSLRFDTPAGGAPLALAPLRGKTTLVNFWATWCAPCIEEMPLLDRFYREHAAKGFQIVGLAIDQPSSVRKFLQRMPVTFPIGLAGLDGTELSRSLGNSAGGLPFSVVFGPDGAPRERRMGRVSEDDLKAWSALS